MPWSWFKPLNEATGWSDPLADLCYAQGVPPVQGCIRETPDDFFVSEILGFEPTGQGEHLLVRVRKRDANSEWLARQLARQLQLRSVAIGYAGRKDRRAVAEQWFSLHLPGRSDPDLNQLDIPGLQILDAIRHDRKLRRGALLGNQFRIQLRSIVGPGEALEKRLETARCQGVPNYFGAQRFGHGAENLSRAEAMFGKPRLRAPRQQRSMWLSAARAHLFNLVLSERVRSGTWNRPIAGDALQFADSGSYFVADAIDQILATRVQQQELHPSGPLWGRGELATRSCAAECEATTLQPWANFRTGLEAAGMKQERRALRLQAYDLDWCWTSGSSLELSFRLGRGSFATALLRELVIFSSGTDEALGA